MFDEVMGFAPVADASEAAIRARAIVFVGKYGARIARAVRQSDGEDGAALAAAFEDMVRDDSVGVAGWPICDLIELLQVIRSVPISVAPAPQGSAVNRVGD